MTAGACVRALIAAVCCSVMVAGCTISAADVPLPGGGIEGDTYELSAQFTDALNLPDKAHVKLGGVRVGTVTAIATRKYRANIRMEVRRDVELPAGTRAELRQSTPLGDIFVALQPPQGRPTGKALADGDTIDVDHTASAATIEDSLTALALLVNGGGLGQLDDIVTEANTALDGRAPTIRNLARELNTTLTTLNDHTGDIDRILKSSDRLTTLAKRRRGTLDAALKDLGPAIDTIAANTGKFRGTLTKAAGAAESSAKILAATEGDLTAVLGGAGPLLDGFNGLGDDLGPTLRTLVKLGKFVHGATKGEAGAGEASIDAGALLEVLRVDQPPGVDDVTRAADASLRTLVRFMEKFAGGTG